MRGVAEGAAFALDQCMKRHVTIDCASLAGMTPPDLNLLVTLDVLLAEGSVAVAARRLRLSPSAMSRALARLRETTGDPLLVRAGRGLVPTPRALELRARVGPVVQEAEEMLRPASALDLQRLVATFSIRASDGFVEAFGPALIVRLQEEAPSVRLRFVQKPDKDSASLRDGSVDLETGVIGPAQSPEIRAQALFSDRFVGVVRQGHPLAQGEVTPDRYAACRHILVSRRGRDAGPIDEALEAVGLRREVATIVGGFSGALALARASDLVAAVPERHTQTMRAGMITFPLPVAVPEITVSLLWHPRLDADPAHRWLRDCVRAICRSPPAFVQA
ncbi:transcriptional regulator, LysR family [Bosea lathyri]|uniref:Transcriptional regulator, LysR family n=2 Tax=Bosea lathyri TaxID=1036778 RepID=A0A1H6BJE9_9HYPH|nr:transcriptional regulator, LysR family [Bosea lathyri]